MSKQDVVVVGSGINSLECAAILAKEATAWTAHLPDLDSSTVGRRVYSPADLESLNVNLVGGDPYSGACTLDQFLLWRPLGATKNHTAPVRDLYHIGASTHPGPGLGGVSGYLVARHLT